MTGIDLRQAASQQVVDSRVAEHEPTDALAAARQQAVMVLLQASSFYGSAACAAQASDGGTLYQQLDALEKETLDLALTLAPVEKFEGPDGLANVNTALAAAELLDAAREV